MKRAFAVAVTLVAVFTAACGGGDDDSPPDQPDGSAETTDAEDAGDRNDGTPAISIEDLAFAPSSLEVPLGTEVSVTNRDSTTHTWTSTSGEWDSGNLAEDATFSHTFAKAGSFPFRCKIHSSMTGQVTVS